jgi:hypothetical protein
MKSRRHLFLFLLLLAAALPCAAALNFLVITITNAGPGPTSVAVADVNGDGKPDLICANHDVSAGNTLTIFTNGGSGIFGSNATITVGNGVGLVLAADMNGDGKPDLVCNGSLGTQGAITVLTNDGTGSFPLGNSQLQSALVGGMVVADINGDGRPDVITANFNANTLSVYTNSANGIGFNASISAPGNPISVVVADVNGDGKPDLISANYTAGAASSVTLWTNNGSGGFVFSANFAGGLNPRRVTVADLNGDGKPDLIVANALIHQLTLLTNNGSGVFGAYTSAGVDLGGAGDVVMADLNGDGRPDLISANSTNNTLTVVTNSSSSPAFAYNNTLTLSATVCQPFSVVAADLNGDGKLDLVTANYGNNTLSVLMNTNVFPAPKLSIASSGGKAVTSWPAWNGGFTLQTNGNLAITAGWATDAGIIGYDGLKNTVTNATTKNLFFRLMH